MVLVERALLEEEAPLLTADQHSTPVPGPEQVEDLLLLAGVHAVVE